MEQSSSSIEKYFARLEEVFMGIVRRLGSTGEAQGRFPCFFFHIHDQARAEKGLRQRKGISTVLTGK